SLDSGAYMVTVTVENLGNAAAEVPITINMQEGEVTKRLQVGRKTTASIRIEAPSAPVEVIVNDGSVPESDMSNNVFRLATSESGFRLQNSCSKSQYFIPWAARSATVSGSVNS